MPALAFYLFSAIAVAGAICLITFRNPVTSAMSMVVSFIGLAALFVGLNAYFVGVIQILVYAGAIMVLFLFIIMLLDLKSEDRRKTRPAILAASFLIPILFLFQLVGVLQDTEDKPHQELALNEAAEKMVAADIISEDTMIHKSLANEDDPDLPDVHLIGHTLYTRYNFPLQVVGVLLLVATIGVVALSKRGSDSAPKSADKP